MTFTPCFKNTSVAFSVHLEPVKGIEVINLAFCDRNEASITVIIQIWLRSDFRLVWAVVFVTSV